MRLNVCVGICSVLLSAMAVQAQSVDAQPGTVFVNTAMGGFILGYDIDQNGTEGLLAESLNQPGGNFNVALETFDQKTGKILKIVSQQTNTHNDFVTLGIFGNSVGLVEFESKSQKGCSSTSVCTPCSTRCRRTGLRRNGSRR